MIAWLLNSFSTATLILLVVGGVAAVAFVASILAQKLMPNLGESSFKEAAGTVETVFAVLFGLVLALAIDDVSSKSAEAETAVANESKALSQLLISSRGFPSDVQTSLQLAIGDYVHAVVEDEWLEMEAATGRRTPRTNVALDSLYQSYQDISMTPRPGEGFIDSNTSAAEFFQESIPKLDEIASARQERLDLSSQPLPALLTILLSVGVVAFIVVTYPATIPHLWVRATVTGLIAAFVAFAFLLTILLDYPFSGDLSVETEPYQSGPLALFWQSEELRPLRPADVGRLSGSDLEGLFDTDQFGATVLRQVGDQIHGVARQSRTTITGTVRDDGVFRGWWCREPGRQEPDAGQVEFRLVRTADGPVIDGRWRSGSEGRFRSGWDLRRVMGAGIPHDLEEQFVSAPFCRDPSGPRPDPSPQVATNSTGGRTVTLTAVADATVTAASPSKAAGSAHSLEVDNSPRIDFLIKFDVSELAQESVARGFLSLVTVNSSDSGGHFAVVGSAWEETTVTWENAPDGGTHAASLAAVTMGEYAADPRVGSAPPTPDRRLEVTSAVQQALADGAVTITFRVTSSSRDGADYASREHPSLSPPQLIVDLS